MMRYSEYIEERKSGYPKWVKGSMIALVMGITKLQDQIENETDLKKQNDLLGRQNRLVSYITGMGVGIDIEDRTLMSRFKTRRN